MSNKETIEKIKPKDIQRIIASTNAHTASIEILQLFTQHQAKELHRQEIMYAYEVGFSDGWNDAKYDKPKYSDAEQYYKETYENNTKKTKCL